MSLRHRKRNGITSSSALEIIKAESDMYLAKVRPKP